MISTGKDMSKFFPDVVKNVVASSFEVRKLVYIYLVRYAEQEPDLALLSINTFQKARAGMHGMGGVCVRERQTERSTERDGQRGGECALSIIDMS
jgi:hypothetical protein